jgi:hypothetical protein
MRRKQLVMLPILCVPLILFGVFFFRWRVLDKTGSIPTQCEMIERFRTGSYPQYCTLSVLDEPRGMQIVKNSVIGDTTYTTYIIRCDEYMLTMYCRDYVLHTVQLVVDGQESWPYVDVTMMTDHMQKLSGALP